MAELALMPSHDDSAGSVDPAAGNSMDIFAVKETFELNIFCARGRLA